MAITPVVWDWNSSASGEPTVSGGATTVGSTILLIATTRSDTATLTVGTDNGGNSYTKVSAVGGDNTTLATAHAWYASNADPASAVTVTSDESTIVHAMAIELRGAAASSFDDASGVATASVQVYGPEEVTPTEDGIVVGVLTLPVTNRYPVQIAAGYTSTSEMASSQLKSLVAYGTGEDGVATGPQWSTLPEDGGSGSATGAGILTVAFKEGSGSPDPLAMAAMDPQSIYVGSTASVSAVVTGGGGNATVAWTKVSGPSGSFLNPSAASTVFTPSGGAGTYVLRAIATETGFTSVQRDMTLTVTAAPSFVTYQPGVSAPGWTPTGGTIDQVLADTSSSTLVTSPDNPTDSTIKGSVIMSGPPSSGQPFRAQIDVRKVSATTGSWVAELWNAGETELYSEVTGDSLPNSISTVEASFPALDLDEITTTQWTTTGLVVVLKFTAA